MQLMRDSAFRTDIEGLRGLAIILVFFYHLRTTLIPGGFVGVDVFYVISGYVIGGSLHREWENTQSVDLARFWGSRMRRLLPASTLTLAATLFAGALTLDRLEYWSLLQDGQAVAVYWGNMRFAETTGDYLRASFHPSALLHFWSLAVEEQFYFAMPLVVRMCPFVAARCACLSALCLASFVLCQDLMATSPNLAFYSMPARAWQLLLGTLTFELTMAIDTRSAMLRACAAFLGVLGIFYSAAAFSSATAFPGLAALVPSTSTAALLYFGPDTFFSQWLSCRPLRWLGARSYAVYLWHWPVFVFGSLWWPTEGLRDVLCVGCSLALAVLSYACMETPIRVGEFFKSTRRSLLLGGVLTSAAIIIANGAQIMDITRLSGYAPTHAAAAPTITLDVVSRYTDHVPSDSLDASTQLPIHHTLYSWSGWPLNEMLRAHQDTLRNGSLCSSVPVNLQPPLSNHFAEWARYSGEFNGDSRYFGVPETERRALFTVLGDSHAGSWAPALERVAEFLGAGLFVWAHGHCPAVAVMGGHPDHDANQQRAMAVKCADRHERHMQHLRETQPHIIFVSHLYESLPPPGFNGTAFEAFEQGFPQWFQRVRAASPASLIVILHDVPWHPEDVAGCLIKTHDPRVCNYPAAAPQLRWRFQNMERRMCQQHGAVCIDTTDLFCTELGCPSVYADTLMYSDDSHMSIRYSRLLAPYLLARLMTVFPCNRHGFMCHS
jgi:peptidoglycan/LPS O-acetylase OafA/YrhL